MILKPAISSLLALLLASGINGQCLTMNDQPAMNPGAKSVITEARYEFALDSLKKTAMIESRDNVFYSPYSLHQALTLAYFGARGETESAVKAALHIPNELTKPDVRGYYGFEKSLRKEEQDQGTQNTNYEYRTANRMWLSNSRRLRECMFDLFGDELEAVNFAANPDGIRARINEWVSNSTKGQIRDLLPDGAIGEDTDMVLANAVYFKGLWKSQFEPENSKKDIFYASGSQNAVTTFMRQKKTFNHVVSEELGAHILELPYKGDEISMYILLPPFAMARSANNASGPATPMERDGVRQLVERISMEHGARELRELIDDGMPPREVEVSLPKFEMERELPLSQLLRAMGAGVLVEPNQADLRGFVADGEQSFHLGDAVHRARIEVTEEGTTAAAATALLSFRSSRPSEPAIFNANHPFVYLIYDKTSRTILFSGIFRTPATSANNAENTAA